MAVAKRVGLNTLEEDWNTQIEEQNGEDANDLVQSISKIGGVFEQSAILSSTSEMIPTENDGWFYGGFAIEGEQTFFSIATPKASQPQQQIHVPELGAKEEVSKINIQESNFSESRKSQVTSLTHCTDAKSLIEEISFISEFSNALYFSSNDRPFVRQYPPGCDYGVFEVVSESANAKWVFVVVPPSPCRACAVANTFAGLLAVSARSQARTQGWVSWALSPLTNLVFGRSGAGEEGEEEEQQQEEQQAEQQEEQQEEQKADEQEAQSGEGEKEGEAN